MNDDLRDIQGESAMWMVHKRFVAIVEDGADFVVVPKFRKGEFRREHIYTGWFLFGLIPLFIVTWTVL